LAIWLSSFGNLALSQVLKDIPLYVITEEKIGLLGTREQAIRLAQDAAMERTIAT